jgi:hypothetical protein
VAVGGRVYVFGGGQVASVDNVVRIDPASGRSALTAHLGEPLSDLGATVIGSRIYLVGGYTGTRYASPVLRYDGAAARLPWHGCRRVCATPG